MNSTTNSNINYISCNLRICFTLMLAVLISGCASSAKYVAPSGLSEPEVQKVITLKTEFRFRNSWEKTDYALVAGKYTAELHGDGGTFYRGPEHAGSIIFSDGSATIYEGGIFVPDQGPKVSRIYFYIPERTPSRQATTQQNADQLAAATNLVVPPVATPGQALTGGIGAGIGMAIVSAIGPLHVGKIWFPRWQSDDQSLSNAIEF